MLISSSIILMLIGRFMKTSPIKEANSLIGYRTKRSMSNQKSWKITQRIQLILSTKYF